MALATTATLEKQISSSETHDHSARAACRVHGEVQRLARRIFVGREARSSGAVAASGTGSAAMPVRAIAAQHHVRMPSFFGYTARSLAILVPLFLAVALVFS